jgi:DNA-directed RNA polymerase subunit RPC12/RpoP
MFFIGIFGIENKEKEIKVLDNISCKKCNSVVKGKIIKSFDYFHFFFIPTFKWNEKYYVICNQCSTLYSISKDKGKAIEHGESIDLTYWDLQQVNENFTGDYYQEDICKNCGKRLENSFRYCPHCGTKIY